MRFRDEGEILNALNRLKVRVEARFATSLYNQFSSALKETFQKGMDDAIYSYPADQGYEERYEEWASHIMDWESTVGERNNGEKISAAPRPYERTMALRDSVDVRKTDKGVFIFVDADELLKLSNERQPAANPDKHPKGDADYSIFTAGAPYWEYVRTYSGEGYFNDAHKQMVAFVANELVRSGNFK
jgi:hypothetical protein